MPFSDVQSVNFRAKCYETVSAIHQNQKYPTDNIDSPGPEFSTFDHQCLTTL